MSTTADLISADLKERSARNQLYWQSSSLSMREKIKYRGKGKSYRRNRVLFRLIDINMKAMVRIARVKSQQKEGAAE